MCFVFDFFVWILWDEVQGIWGLKVKRVKIAKHSAYLTTVDLTFILQSKSVREEKE